MNRERYESWQERPVRDQAAVDSISRHRTNRANKLVLILRRFGITARAIEETTPEGAAVLWEMAEAYSTIKPETLPTSEVTRGMALEILRTMEKVTGESDADLFGRL